MSDQQSSGPEVFRL